MEESEKALLFDYTSLQTRGKKLKQKAKARSRGWGLSIGGRCHGLVWATAIKDSFIKLGSGKATQSNPYPVAKEYAPEYAPEHTALEGQIAD